MLGLCGAHGPGPGGAPHLRREVAPFLLPGDGGTGYACSPAVQPHSAAFVYLGSLWTHLDPGPVAPCRQSLVRMTVRAAHALPAPPSALPPHRARGARPWPRAALRCCGLGTGTGLGLRARCLAGAGYHGGFAPSAGAGHQGPLMQKSGISVCWDWSLRGCRPHSLESCPQPLSSRTARP